MTQTLRIDSDEAVRLANELASVTGQPLEAAVTAALNQTLERRRVINERVEKIMASAAAFRELMTEPGSSDHSWMYDEFGAPI